MSAPRWDVRVVASTGSTNADLMAAARAGVPEGRVLVAEAQTAGRGRLGRAWVAPAGTALTFSVLLRPIDVPPARWGWLPLLAGLALAQAVPEPSGPTVTLKWPNDLLAGDRKVAGILVERVETPAGAAAVVGFGVNVSTGAADLPVPTATSLALAGAPAVERRTLLGATLHRLAGAYVAWRAAEGDADRAGLRAEYARRCATIGRVVRVELPGGQVVAGRAEGVDVDGRLVVDGRALAAGDVVHVR